MFKFVAVLALALAANAQVLRISNAVIGSSSAGSQQVFQLGAGGSRQVLLARPQAIIAQPTRLIQVARPIQYAQIQPTRLIQIARPQAIIAQPRVIQVARPIAYTAAVDETPKPYAFAFDSVDEFGARHAREEQANGSGAVSGSYTIQDSAAGTTRVVTYVADENGFRADVKTNEPGTQTSNPAAATYSSSAQ